MFFSLKSYFTTISGLLNITTLFHVDSHLKQEKVDTFTALLGVLVYSAQYVGENTSMYKLFHSYFKCMYVLGLCLHLTCQSDSCELDFVSIQVERIMNLHRFPTHSPQNYRYIVVRHIIRGTT